MDNDQIVWIVVVVAVVLLLLLLAGLPAQARRRRAATSSASRAPRSLRGEAAGRAPDVQSAAQRAQLAEAEAERARAQAAQAERVAAEAHRDLDHEQAAQEDVVREADELDPRVDTARQGLPAGHRTRT